MHIIECIAKIKSWNSRKQQNEIKVATGIVLTKKAMFWLKLSQYGIITEKNLRMHIEGHEQLKDVLFLRYAPIGSKVKVKLILMSDKIAPHPKVKLIKHYDLAL